MTPDEARDALDQASAARHHMSDGLRLPSYFYSSIGLAIAVQIATMGVAISGPVSPRASFLALMGGIVMFLVLAAVPLWRFRRLNGAWVAGLASRVVLGTSFHSSLVYGLGMCAAAFAGLERAWWAVAASAILTGVGYAWAGQRWWAAYRKDPQGHLPDDSWATTVALVVLAVGFLVLAVLSR